MYNSNISDFTYEHLFTLNSTRIWFGTQGTFFSSVDGELTWGRFNQPNQMFWGFVFVDFMNGFAFDQMNFKKTTDGGETWGKEQTKIVANLNQIRFYKNIAGYVVGDGGVILKKQLIFTDIKKDKINNFSFNLLQNYPNPFNPGTRIRYEVAEMTNVKIIVYDILGRKITELVNEIRQAGSYDLYFDAAKYGLSSGVYIYRISAGKYVQDKKMIFIK
jgi:hypothetical protein